MDKKVTLAQLKEVVQEAYDQVKTNTGGKTQGGKSRCFLYRVTLDWLYELVFWFEEQRNVELMVALRT